MRALDAKMWRDLRRLGPQILAIALVLACGIAVLVLANGTARSLTETRTAFYDRNRFADVFAGLTRAPRSLLAELARIDGVAQAEGRIALAAILDLPGMAEPASARLLSLPAAGAALNLPLLRAGRMPDPLRPDEVLVLEPFAQANGLHPGDSLRAILNGRARVLTIAGTALSPEFIYTIGPGGMLPDDRRFAVIWMGETAAAALGDLGGAFNDLSLRLVRGADPQAVIAAVDPLLAPYGGTGAYGRDRQLSHAFVENEMNQLAAMALVLPPVFLIVSAFLVNMVLGRLIALERRQIGLLKALGYSTRAVALHYLKLSIGIGALGIAIGWAAGWWLGRATTQLYAEFFRFPWLIYLPGAGAFALSGLLGLITVIAGALRAVWATVRLSPAAAMSPPAPTRFRRGLADGLGRAFRLRQTSMMILRSITRWPGRAAISVFGVAASVAVLVASLFMFDAMDRVLDEMFNRTNHKHVSLTLAGPKTLGALAAARALPGVMQAEPGFVLPVRLRAGHLTKLTALQAMAPDLRLSELLNDSGGTVLPPDDGLLLSQGLADALGLRPGDKVTVEALAPPRETWQVPVTALVRQSMGQGAYISDRALFRLMRGPDLVNQIDLRLDMAALPAFYAAVKASPAVAGMVLWPELRQQFDRTIGENMLTMIVIYLSLGMLITFGVIYNAARIQLSERSHELASLRVLGFTRAEVGFVLVGEIMLLAALAVPLGWVSGYGFAALMVRGFSSDLVSIPLVVGQRSYAVAALVALSTALASVLLVRRRLDRIDIVSALKARE